MAKTKPIKVGDSVVVRAGVKDPDFGSDLGGWQGRVSEIDPDAIIAEPQDRGPFKSGQAVRVKEIFEVEDLYGVLVTMTRKRSTYQFPLCDLEAKDKQSGNYKVLRNYVVWFANR